MSNFVALDVETANLDRASICAVGAVRYAQGLEVRALDCLVNPNCDFDPFNVRIHGVSAETVKAKPTLAEALPELVEFLAGSVVVTHSGFDRVAIEKASKHAAIELPAVRWLDSCRVARRCWKGMKSYTLGSLCDELQYAQPFRAGGYHNHLEDAKAAAFIILRALEETRLDLEGLLDLQRTRCSDTGEKLDGRAKRSRLRPSVRRIGDGDGALVGEVLCFTGKLTMSREVAADLAAEAGGDVEKNVTRKTTILVLGEQDLSRLVGKDKSDKHLKAEELISKGQSMRIIGESDFELLASITE